MKLPEVIKNIILKYVMRAFVAIEVSNQGVLNSISQFQVDLNIKAKHVEIHYMHFT